MNRGSRQSACVNVYWTPNYVEDLDQLCALLSMRRNEFIKQAVEEKRQREMEKLMNTSGHKLLK